MLTLSACVHVRMERWQMLTMSAYVTVSMVR